MQQEPAQPAQASSEVLYTGPCKQTAWLGGYIKWFLVCVAGGLVAWGLSYVEFFAAWPMWILGLLGIPGLFWTFLKSKSTHYKITLRRVEFERGVLTKEVDSLELWRVVDVRYRQSLLDRVLNNATITLLSTDQSDPEFSIYGLPHHRKLFEDLREAVQSARQKGRPMEFAHNALDPDGVDIMS